MERSSGDVRYEDPDFGAWVQYQVSRDVEVDSEGYLRAVDPCHAQILMDEMGVEEPTGTEIQPRGGGDENLVSAWSPPDRPDLCVVADVLSRSMAKPQLEARPW